MSTHTEHGNGELLLPGIGGSPGKFFNSCQTQGNPFSFSFQKVTNNPGNSQYVKGYAYMKERAMSQKGQRGEPPHFVESMHVHKNGLRKLYPEPRLNTSVNENFVKNTIFNLKSNFGQASQKKIKNSILYSTLNFKNDKYGGTIMMSQFKASIYSYKSSGKNSVRYYSKIFRNFYLGNEARYMDFDHNLSHTSFNYRRQISLNFPHFNFRFTERGQVDFYPLFEYKILDN